MAQGKLNVSTIEADVLAQARVPAPQNDAGSRSIHQLFESQAEIDPDNVAVVFEDASLTYRELNERANQLAHHLQAIGVGPDVLVGLCLERSCDLVVGILGILKAGGAYVPLDPAYPKDRLALMLQDAEPLVLLTQDALRDQLPKCAAKTVAVDSDWAVIAQQGVQNPSCLTTQDHLMYVIYTSGSTGTPKGVMVTHHNVVRLFNSLRPYFEFNAANVWTMFHSYAFGFSVWEIWGALIHGGQLVVVPTNICMSPRLFFDLLSRQRVTILSQTPSAFRQLFLTDLAAGPLSELSLRRIVFSGEPIVPQDLRMWFEKANGCKAELIDTYAITEAGGQIAYRSIDPAGLNRSSANCLGQILSDTQVYVLDADMKPVPRGSSGELYIAGPGVARGYLNRQVLTNERFLANPFANENGSRLYKTGDRARLLADGNVALLGRVDDQVKIRGYRVELGEIESALRDHRAVREAAVVVRELAPGDRRLVAYVVPHKEHAASCASYAPEKSALNANNLLNAGDEFEFWPDPGQYQIYDDLLFYLMTHDSKRIDAYKYAIEKHVKDKVVLDIGTGSDAILARLCVTAGAKIVYATEILDDAFEKASSTVHRLALDDKIVLIHGDTRDVVLPEKADVVTHALLGNIGSSDGVVPILNSTRRLIRNNGICIPAQCVTNIAAVHLPDNALTRRGFNEVPQHYVDKIFELRGRPFDLKLCVHNFPASNIISNVEVFEHLDFRDFVDTTYTGQATFEINKDATFDGFLLWTNVITTDGKVLDSLAHQRVLLPVYFPAVYPAMTVSKGDMIKVTWSCAPCENKLNPDYSISGSVITKSGEKIAFDYACRYYETVYGGTGIHRLLLRPNQDRFTVSSPGLRDYLRRHLPEFMVPSKFIWLDELPLTPNGKLDRDRLPAPDDGRAELTAEYVEPRSNLEKSLVEAWQEVLGIEKVGIHDNFFELGGTSILGMQLVSKLQDVLGDYVYVVALFDAPTVAKLSAYLIEHYRDSVNLAYGEQRAIEYDAEASTNSAAEVTKVTAADVTALRSAIPPLRPRGEHVWLGSKNPRAIFILSAPRSGSTLLRVMLAGHPKLFAPPELVLLSFNTLRERRKAHTARNAVWLEGTIRALMQFTDGDAEEAQRIMSACEDQGMTTKEFYRMLQERIGAKTLVDKTSYYALDIETLKRAEADFDNPIFVHLVRHPLAMIRSFEAGKFQFYFPHPQDFPPGHLAELIWTISHTNVLEFLSGIPNTRQHRVMFEDLVTRPQPVMEQLAQCLGIDYDPQILEVYEDQKRRMTDPISQHSKMLGDFKFHDYKGIDASVADKWKDDITTDFLGDVTWELAERFGYDRASRLDQDKPVTQQAQVASPSLAALPPLVPNPSARYEPFPLTDVQEAYWVGRGGDFELGNVSTHLYIEIDSNGLDLDRFRGAWQRVVDRHDTLRAVIDSNGLQRILRDVPSYEIDIYDLTGDVKSGVYLEKVRREMSHQVLRSDRWPLFDIRASRLNADQIRLHFSIDFLICDARSLQIFSEELVRFYDDPDCCLPTTEISFRDYVVAVQSLRQSPIYERSLEYWRGIAAELPPAPELPLAKAPASVKKSHFIRRGEEIDREDWTRLKSRAGRVGVTPAAVLLQAFADTLSQWCRHPSLTLNLTLFNRLPLHPQVDDLVGDFTSLILLGFSHQLQGSFEERVRVLQRQLWNGLDHRYVSGIQVLRELAKVQTGVAPNMPVVFTSLLGLGGAGQDSSSFQRFGREVFKVSQTPQVWIDHVVSERSGKLRFNWDVVEELFLEGMIDDVFNCYAIHLRRLVEDEASWQHPWAETSCRLLPPEQKERRQQVNATSAPISNALLHGLFVDQAKKHPRQAVIVARDRRLNYGELDRLSNQVAAHLRESGVVPNTLVAIVMNKGWEQMVAALGILKAGAAYLPIDAGLPAARLHYLFNHGEVRLALTQPAVDQQTTWPEGVHRICVCDDSLRKADDSPVMAYQSPDDLAYVIYTSGSTGKPKGVMIDHRGAVNTILDVNERFAVGADDRVLALSSLSFDLSVYDIFGTLAAGGTIVVPDAAGTRNPAHWADLMLRERVTIWNSVPALMQVLIEYLDGRALAPPPSLRLALLSGDWIPTTLPDRIRAWANGTEVISLGGATEASIWSILYRIGRVDPAWKSIPYGQPMRNQQFHVLNDALEACPDWVPGELFIGGIGLAKGYWRDTEKTSASFFHHPRTGERLYRTGDLGRFRPDGNIEFLGRDDFQVKIQGYRIELGEIEAALAEHPDVRSAVVTAAGTTPDDKRLVAYFVADHAQGPTTEDLRDFLAEKLPAYMVPSVYVPLDTLPLTANGKVDRRVPSGWLPDPPEIDQATLQRSESGQSELACICELVRQILKVPSLDPAQNLLTLGATSIDMIRIANLLDKELGFRPEIGDLYRDPTPSGLTKAYLLNLSQRRMDFQRRANRDVTATDGLGTPSFAFEPLLAPQEREAFKQQQPGLRRNKDGEASIPLVKRKLDENLRESYTTRRSHRTFSAQPIPFSDFGKLLTCLSPISVNGKPKYRYASAGGLYPVQAYVWLKPNAVESLAPGAYYFHPVDHRFVQISTEAVLDREIYDPLINRPIFDKAAFSVFLVAQLSAIAPMYRGHSIQFATIEAGLITQLLETAAPDFGIGLCQIGGLDGAQIRDVFGLEPSHVLVHSLVGGSIGAGCHTEWQPFQEAYDNLEPANSDREVGTI